MSVRALDFVADSEDSIRDLVRTVQPEWQSESLVLRCFVGGVTNRLYGVRAESADEGRTLLVRIFGEGSELLIDREREKGFISFLHGFGLAKPLYACFSNGFVYGYMLGKALTLDKLRSPEMYPCIAAQLATWHSIPPTAQRMNQEPKVVTNLKTWSSLVPTPYSIPGATSKVTDLLSSRDRLQEEIQCLSDQLVAVQSPIVFCHNDTTMGNILEHDSHPDKVALIDYEYCGWNYRCYDLGNMFCEYCGVDNMDFSLYPSKSEQLDFLAAYAAKVASVPGAGKAPDVDQLYREACIGALASSLQWALWGLVQEEHSLIDFDYAKYALLRFHEYFRRKEEFIDIAASRQS